MSGDERSFEDLKSLVVHTLETNGVLGQIRAQLRANVYKAIDCDEEQSKEAAPPSKLTKSPVGRLMAEIVAEFFEFYEFNHSLSVFVPESNLGRERRSRTEVAFDAGLARVRTDVSILEQLIDFATSSSLHKAGDGWHSGASSTTASSPPLQSASLGSSRTSTADKSAASEAKGNGAGTAAAIASAINVIGPGTRVGGKVGDDARDDAPEDVARDRRKPLGKLPSLGSSGKEMLPPFKAGAIGAGAAIGGATKEGEEVTLGENALGASRDKHMDKHAAGHVARLRSPTSASGMGLASASNSDVGTPEHKDPSKAEEANQSASKDSVSPAAARSRSASASPAASAESPPLSAGASPAASPSGSPAASMSRSLGVQSMSQSYSEVQDSSVVQSESLGSPSRSPSRSPAAKSGAIQPVVVEDAESISVSVDESEGSEPIEIGRGLGVRQAQDPLSAGPRVTVTSNQAGTESDEVEEEIEESLGDSIEGYRSDQQSSSNDKF